MCGLKSGARRGWTLSTANTTRARSRFAGGGGVPLQWGQRWLHVGACVCCTCPCVHGRVCRLHSRMQLRMRAADVGGRRGEHAVHVRRRSGSLGRRVRDVIFSAMCPERALRCGRVPRELLHCIFVATMLFEFGKSDWRLVCVIDFDF